MAGAAVTPRVRTIVICDDVSASLTEDGVFTLEGVRVKSEASTFPSEATLWLFMLLSSTRKGRYSGRILVVNENNDKVVRYAKFTAAFGEDNELLPAFVEVHACVFPEPGQYNFEVYFSGNDGRETLKGEHPLVVRSPEE